MRPARGRCPNAGQPSGHGLEHARGQDVLVPRQVSCCQVGRQLGPGHPRHLVAPTGAYARGPPSADQPAEDELVRNGRAFGPGFCGTPGGHGDALIGHRVNPLGHKAPLREHACQPGPRSGPSLTVNSGEAPRGPGTLDLHSCYDGATKLLMHFPNPPSNNRVTVMGSKRALPLGGVQVQSPWPCLLFQHPPTHNIQLPHQRSIPAIRRGNDGIFQRAVAPRRASPARLPITGTTCLTR